MFVDLAAQHVPAGDILNEAANQDNGHIDEADDMELDSQTVERRYVVCLQRGEEADDPRSGDKKICDRTKGEKNQYSCADKGRV